MARTSSEQLAVGTESTGGDVAARVPHVTDLDHRLLRFGVRRVPQPH